jgi:DNA invertase Pin-like site-specific DNA recombinase
MEGERGVPVKRAYSYIRFSRDVQKLGDSERRQAELAARWLQERKDYVLDESLRLQDLGVSAFRGRHVAKGKLGDFLEAIRMGRVPKGSVLLIEALDRLGREELDVVHERFNGILRAGIDIVTLLDGQHYTRRDLADLGKTLLAVVKMYAAGEESRKKSERLKAGWAERRKRASREKMTGVCPAWLRPTWKRLADGSIVGTKDRFEVIPERAEAIRQIYRWAVEGHGIDAITKKCNNKFPPMGKRKSGCWTRSYVARILADRAVLGEMQATTWNPKLDDPDLSDEQRRKLPQRVDVGEKVIDYYPRIISDALFHQAQTAMKGRRRGARRPKGGEALAPVHNLFAGLVTDARDGRPMNVLSKGRKGGPDGNGGRHDKRVLVSAGARRGEAGSKYVSFCYSAFEGAFLQELAELTPAAVLPAEHEPNGEDEVTELSGRLGELNHKIESVKKRVLLDPDIESLADALKTLEQEKKTVAGQLDRAKANRDYAGAERLGEAQTLARMLDDCPADELAELRSRVRAALRQLVKNVVVLVVARGTARLAAVQCFFNPDGRRRRDFLVMTQGDHRLAGSPRRPARTPTRVSGRGRSWRHGGWRSPRQSPSPRQDAGMPPPIHRRRGGRAAPAGRAHRFRRPAGVRRRRLAAGPRGPRPGGDSAADFAAGGNFTPGGNTGLGAPRSGGGAPVPGCRWRSGPPRSGVAPHSARSGRAGH